MIPLKVSVVEHLHDSLFYGLFLLRSGIRSQNHVSLAMNLISISTDNISMTIHSIFAASKAILVTMNLISVAMDGIIPATYSVVTAMNIILLTVLYLVVGAVKNVSTN